MRNSDIFGILVLLQQTSACSVGPAFYHCTCNDRNPLLLKVSNMNEISELLPYKLKGCHLKIRLININIISYGDLPTIRGITKLSIFGDKVKLLNSGMQ